MNSKKAGKKTVRPAKRKPVSRWLKAGTIVKVEWEDAFVTSGWQKLSDAEQADPQIIEQVGHVLTHNKDGIMLAMGRDIATPPAYITTRYFVPNGMIRNIKVLR